MEGRAIGSSDVRELLDRHVLNFHDEAELQAGIEKILKAAGIEFLREVRLSGKDRIDFQIGRLGIEAKVDGSLSAVTRQLHRYAQLETIGELLLVTTRAIHLDAATILNGKKIEVYYLSLKRGL